jgi:hypothetical protein
MPPPARLPVVRRIACEQDQIGVATTRAARKLTVSHATAWMSPTAATRKELCRSLILSARRPAP